MTLIEIRSIQFIVAYVCENIIFMFVRCSAELSVKQYWLNKSKAGRAVTVVLLNVCGRCSTSADKSIIGNARKKESRKDWETYYDAQSNYVHIKSQQAPGTHIEAFPLFLYRTNTHQLIGTPRNNWMRYGSFLVVIFWCLLAATLRVHGIGQFGRPVQ